MRKLYSYGVLIVRGEPIDSFLLMRHATRWDLPKGHIDEGETEIQCALRELVEETGITADDICLLYTSPSPRDATLSRMPSSA